MLDINKYLETQKSLAQNKLKERKNSLKLKREYCQNVSSKSLKTAESIAKKEFKLLKKNKCSFSEKKKLSTSVRKRLCESSTSCDSDSDADYNSSNSFNEDEEVETYFPSAYNRNVSKSNLVKIIDDGNRKCYEERMNTWKTNLKNALNGEKDVPATSADVAYVQAALGDVDKLHELKCGLVVSEYIWSQLYKYQKAGVKWLWELHQVKSGGLLGDEMGLGKTIQMIAFMAAVSRSGGLGPSLVVVPATVLFQWVAQFHYWWPVRRVVVLHAAGSHATAAASARAGTNAHTAALLRDAQRAHAVVVLTYAGLTRHQRELLAHRWHYVVLDEGHKIRNPDTQVSKLVKKFSTPHRIVISGSPLQNNLQELWSLFDFMSPGLLGTQAVFTDYFAVPITQGGYANATSLQEVTALELAKSLKNIITPYMIRRTKDEVQEHIKLPEKTEQVLFCSLSHEQRDLYLGYLMSGTVRSILDKDNRHGEPMRARILVAISTLRKICNHPDLYLYEAREESELPDDENFGFWKRSGKMTVVHSLLKIWKKQGHRALVFSQSRAMICILEQYLIQNSYKYLKMDGTVSVSVRQNMIKTFNEDDQFLVFLATTRVGGLGVNLTGADRVVIYDPDWNPATDSQAKERAWRIGQRRNVTVYRLLSQGTIEEKIYQRQVFKQLLSNKVLIDPKQKNPLSTSTLQGLFTLEEPNREGDTETASVFKHTKVDLDRKESRKRHAITERIAEMRRRAKEISRNITAAKNLGAPDADVDPRERYKEKRDRLINLPVVEEPRGNRLDDRATDCTFDDVLSELDIVNLHRKKNYVENLLKERLEGGQGPGEREQSPAASTTASRSILEATVCTYTTEVSNSTGNMGSLVATPLPRDDKLCAHNLTSVKKVKKKKREKDMNLEGETKTDDDYVLSALFAGRAVRGALRHDAVVGLRAREDALHAHELARRRARGALRALRLRSAPRDLSR